MPVWLLLAHSIAICALLGLAILALARAPRRALHRTFAAFCLSLALWLGSLVWFYLAGDSAALTPIGRTNFAAIALAVAMGSWFVDALTRRHATWRRRAELVETALVLLVTVATPWVSVRESLLDSGEIQTTFGPLAWLLAAHLAWYIGAGCVRLRQFALAHRGTERSVAMLLLNTFAVVSLAIGLTNLAFPLLLAKFSLQSVGPLAVLLLAGAFAYAVLARGLFDIRPALQRTIVFGGLLAGALGGYGMLALLASATLRRQPIGGAEFLFDLALVCLIAATAEPLRAWLAERSDAWLYMAEREQDRALSALASRLSLADDIQSLADRAASWYAQTFEVQRVALMLVEESDAVVAVRDLPAAVVLGHARRLLGRARGWSADADKRRLTRLSDSDRAALDELGIDLAVPILGTTKPAGLILLGRRERRRWNARERSAVLLAGASILQNARRIRLLRGQVETREFVSVAAHELLTPVAAMRGYLSMILDEGIGSVDGVAHEHLERVRHAAEHLDALVRDLLTVARLESGKRAPEPSAVNVAALCQEILEQAAPLARQKGLRLLIERGSAAPNVWADARQLREVLLNLVGNAIKYTPSGSVRIGLEADTGHARIRVRDTGVGIAPEDHSRLFEKFSRIQTDQTRDIPGTGLGLYVTRQLIERNGGSIVVESAPGEGSCFTVTLPLHPE